MKYTHSRTTFERRAGGETLVALPIFNEEHTVSKVFGEIRDVYSGDILFLDDGSTDRSAALIESFEGDGVTLIAHSENRGYGQSIISVFEYAMENHYKSLVIMDGDGQHEARLIPPFVEGLEDFDVVSGSRYYSLDQAGDAAPEERRRINVEVTRTINRCLGISLTDAFCGYKAYRVDALRSLRLDATGYAFPLQFWVQAVGAGLSISEIAVPRVYLDLNRSFGRELDDPEVRFNYYMNVFDQEFHKVFGTSYHDACKKRVTCCKCSADDGV